MAKIQRERLRGGDSLSWWPQAVLIVALALMLLPWLGEIVFNSKGEPREAIVAVSMLDSGDWVLPRSFGNDMPYKPPFLAWLIAVFALVFNGGVVSEYISRLPSALALIGLCWVVYRWAAHHRGARFGMLVAMLTATSFEMFRSALTCRVDMVLTACMVGGIIVLARSMESPAKWRYPVAVLLLSCATLTKGPIGSLLPCLITGIYFLLRRRNFWVTLGVLTAVCLASFVLPAIWYAAAWHRGGDAFFSLAYEENILRLTGKMTYDSHLNPWWYNFVTLAYGLLPWTLLVVLAAACVKPSGYLALRNKAGRRRLSSAGLLSVVGIVCVVAFYTIPASKRSVYLLPAYPFAAYILAAIFMRIRLRWPAEVMAWLLSCLSLAAPVAVLIYGITHNVEASPVGYAALAVPLVTGAWWILRRNRAMESSVICAAAMYMAYAAAAGPMILNGRTDRGLANEIARERPTGYIYQLADDPATRLFTINFYLHDRLRPVRTAPADAPRGTVLLAPEGTDTTGLSDKGWKLELLTPRSCDHRSPVWKAVRQ